MVNTIINQFKKSRVFGAYESSWHCKRDIQYMMEIICDLPINSPVAAEAAGVMYSQLYGRRVAC